MKKNILLSTVCFFLGIGAVIFPATESRAQEMGSLDYYAISRDDYIRHNYEWRLFLQYHLQREPCQNYRQPPPGYVLKGCQVYRVEERAKTAAIEWNAVQNIQPAAGETTQVIAPAPPRIIYFDFDRATIRDSEKDKLSRIIADLRTRNPAQVTVAGHADRAGPADYNVRLSERRAKAVAEWMMANGIQGSVIDQKAYGESDPAVQTADGVPLQENRRAVITGSP